MLSQRIIRVGLAACALALWVHPASGAAPPPHWAFQPVTRGPPPPVQNTNWPANAVDQFILATLEQHGLRPAPPAGKATLIRRATYDLTGLPPTPEEVEAFEKDTAPGAFARVVDRLLSSPQYGEQWGRHWLDVVRYADTAGENTDHPLPHAWRYRNWVIQSFNQDQPYDEFIREQIAGDLLAPAGPRERFAGRIVATGYLALARRFGHDIDKDIHLTFEDTIDTVGKSVLGLTLGCARCHDHKYDPVTTRDYYGLYGIFASTRFSFPGCEPNQHPRDLIPLLPKAEADALLKPFQAELDKLDQTIKTRESELAQAKEAGSELVRDQVKPLTAALAQAKKRRQEFAAQNPLPVAYGATDALPVNARVQKRGDPEQLGDEVPRKFLDFLGGQFVSATNHSGRLELAQWLTNPKNPLTARVMANRIWQWHFGRGLVKTPNDFGLRGQPPSHPELLDYLAAEFVQNGWRVKAMHRLLMLSATYQQGSVAITPESTDGEPAQLGGAAAKRSESFAGPPGSTATGTAIPDCFSPFPRRRLAAEELRDTLLAVSGELDRTPGEAHPFPSEEKWNFTQHAPFAAEYETRKRSVYVMQKRNRRTPFFALFDGADPNASTALRETTTVPTQALFFMNDPFVHGCAEKLADLILAAGKENRQRLDFACRLLFARPATAEDYSDASEFLREYVNLGGDDAPEKRATLAWRAYARVLLSSNELLHLD